MFGNLLITICFKLWFLDCASTAVDFDPSPPCSAPPSFLPSLQTRAAGSCQRPRPVTRRPFSSLTVISFSPKPDLDLTSNVHPPTLALFPLPLLPLTLLLGTWTSCQPSRRPTSTPTSSLEPFRTRTTKSRSKTLDKPLPTLLDLLGNLPSVILLDLILQHSLLRGLLLPLA